MKPILSVIMPVYNTEKYLKDAVESILTQTFAHFEFIIIDDCSTDSSYEILQTYAEKDSRIKLYKNEANRGISYTRNKLINLTSTNFLATQDSDDISMKERLEKEYNFLVAHEEYAVVGSNNEIIDEQGKTIWYRAYSNNIPSVILKKSPLSQPSTMFRKNIFLEVGWYDNINYGEDYDLWLKFYSRWYKIKNLDKILLKLRIREGQSKYDKLKQTLKNTIFIQKRAIKEYGIHPSFSDKAYIFLEKILLHFPKGIIIGLFKLLAYKKKI